MKRSGSGDKEIGGIRDAGTVMRDS